jgi:hypothetical protein
MTPGQRTVNFITRQETLIDNASLIRRLPGGTVRQWARYQGGRKEKAVWSALGLARRGRLTTEAFFELWADAIGVNLFPGFLDDPVRCFPEAEAYVPGEGPR